MNKKYQYAGSLIVASLVLTGVALVARDVMLAGIAILFALGANVMLWSKDDTDEGDDNEPSSM